MDPVIMLMPFLQEAQISGAADIGTILLSLLGGGGVVGAMAKYIVSQQKAHIKTLEDQLISERARNDKAQEVLALAVAALPELAELLGNGNNNQ